MYTAGTLEPSSMPCGERWIAGRLKAQNMRLAMSINEVGKHEDPGDASYGNGPLGNSSIQGGCI